MDVAFILDKYFKGTAERSPGLHLQVGAIHVLSFLKLYRQGLYYETSMALVTFCFGSIFGMVTVRMPSSTLAEI